MTVQSNNSSPISAGLVALCESQRTSSGATAIAGLCNELLDLAGIDSAPTPLRRLLDRLSIASRTLATYQPGAGLASLVATDEGMAIKIHDPDLRKNFRRTRFSIAHELVHALILRVLREPQLIASLDATPEAHAELERLCDLGASHLLMPPRLLREHARDGGLTPLGLLGAYDKFLVSQDVLIHGIASVLPKGAALRWRLHARSPAEEPCWRIVRSYPGYGVDTRRPWLPQGATTSHISEELPEQVARLLMPCPRDDLTVTLGKRSWTRSAYATFLAMRSKATTRPLFADLEVSDEFMREKDVLVFLCEKGVAPWISYGATYTQKAKD